MKKIFTFIAVLMLAAAALAQVPDNPNRKLNLMVGDFTGDYSNQIQSDVLKQLSVSYRANVIEKSAYESLPQAVRNKIHFDAIITGKCVFKIESEQKTLTDLKGNKRNATIYKATMNTTLIFSDPAGAKSPYSVLFESTSSNEDRNKAIASATQLGFTKGKQSMLILVQLLTLDEYLQENFPVRGEVLTINDIKKNSAETVNINLGWKDAVYRGQTFEIVSYKNGKEKNYGRLRVREINDDSISTCIVEKGGKDIKKAFDNGEDLKIVNYVQALSLNGIIRAEQEAPRLKITSIDEVRVRGFAFSGITGNAPSNFVNAVKEKLKDNHRIYNYQLGDKNCPPLESLDGIACGYYTGMQTSSRLVKAEDHLLQLKDYTEYTTKIGWYLFIVDPKTGNIVYAGSQGATGISDKNQDDATRQATDNASNITSATYSAYPLIGSILTVDNGDPKKATDVTIDLGSDFPVYQGILFDAYAQDATGGWEKIGRIKVSSITDGTHASCTVKKGGEAIRKAVEADSPIRITTFILKELLEL